MQGRLSEPVDGRIQAFPVEQWRDEFDRAAAAGLDCIEWIYELPNEERNPLAHDAVQIRQAVVDTGVAVSSVCADYYMVERLVDIPNAVEHLLRTVKHAAEVSARYVVLPFVDESSLRPGEAESLVSILHGALPRVEDAGVELHLETDLAPTDLVALLERIGHPLVRANYDIGNSASLGHDPREELPGLRPWLGSVHVKDRVRGGGTVPLGTGSADLPACFRLIAETGFSGPYILQAARGTTGDEVALAADNRLLVESLLVASAAHAS
jgi:hexulose-6-phosphate isomerase